ncbi:MAG: hypothetical protein WC941_10755 [Candidatus Bathyarchaeia archaeon]
MSEALKRVTALRLLLLLAKRDERIRGLDSELKDFEKDAREREHGKVIKIRREER